MGTEPRRYRARHIEPGVISYEDVGQGLVLVGRAALDRMRPSFVGMPVFNFVHKDVDADEAFDFENAAKETMAVGIISGVGVGDDGWDWADMMIWDEQTQTNIDEKGFTVSCAYDVLKAAGPGKHHGVDYDEEVLDGKYVHMAIVDNPRYEDSTIVRNAKGGQTVAGEKVVPKAQPKRGWFFTNTKKNAEPPKEAVPPKKEEPPKENADEGLNPEGGETGEAFCVIDGKKIPLSEVLAAVEQAEGEPQENAVGETDEVTSPSGKKYTGAELMAAYKAKMGGTAENAVPEVETEVQTPDAAMVKKNSRGEEIEKPNEHFISVKKNAAKPVEAPEAPRPTMAADRYAAGKERYGSPVPGGK